MSSLTSLIRTAARRHRTDDPMIVAKRLIKSLTKPQLVQAIADDVRDAQREATHEVERSAWPRFYGDLKTAGRSAPNSVIRSHMSRLRNLWAQSVSLCGDGRIVLIGKMTVEEHEIRAAYLEKMAQGYLDTARMHREAAQTLRKYKIHCLEDLAKSKSKSAKKKSHRIGSALSATTD